MSDNGDSYLVPWWWIATWVIWGTMMALITYVIEGVIVSSLLWFLAGFIYAICFFPVMRPLIPPVMDWFYLIEGGIVYAN